jgi:short-subunit dehydrogenase
MLTKRSILQDNDSDQGESSLEGKGNAIIIGASSGIGEALARLLARVGYRVGMCARRGELLTALQSELPGSAVRQMDVGKPDEAIELFRELVEEMGGADMVVISAGTGFINPELEWLKEKTTIDVNVVGFCALAGAAVKYFIGRGQGHLVGISSVAALFGSHHAPAYNASKAFVSNYLEGLRGKVRTLRLPVTITDIRPGFVDTAMAQGAFIFWAASPEKAARQIYEAIRKKRACAYVTRRWRLLAWLVKIAPRSLLSR